jgi:hypothetical protein
MGVAAKNLATGETVFVNADTQFDRERHQGRGDIEVFHQIAEGRIRRDDTIPDETRRWRLRGPARTAGCPHRG